MICPLNLFLPDTSFRSAFASYAVETRTGPHVTIQAGVVHAGRFWTTTSRDSLKARSVRAHSFSAALLDQDGADGRVIAGKTISLDLSRPLDSLGDPLSTLFATGAVLRLGVDQVRQVVGYLESAGQIPSGWLPHRRVLLVTDIDRSLLIEDGRVVRRDGRWDNDTTPPVLDETHENAPLPLHLVPDPLRDKIAADLPVRLGVATADGPVVLPAAWGPDDTVAVSAEALAMVRGELPGPACITVDDSSSRRPERKLGAMFRGAASIVTIDDAVAHVALRTERVTTWNGFEANTVAVEHSS